MRFKYLSEAVFGGVRLCLCLLLVGALVGGGFTLPGYNCAWQARSVAWAAEGQGDSPGQVSFEQEPFVLDGHTFVPLRELAGHLGIDVGWDGKENRIIISDGQVGIYFQRLAEQPGLGVAETMGDNPAVSGAQGDLEEEFWPYWLEEDRLFLPLRYLAGHFDWKLSWDPLLKEVALIANTQQGSPVLLRFAADEPYSRRLWPTPRRVAYLTFDDGPSQLVTPLILDILEQENVKATFFVVGEQIKKNPEILKRIQAEGHTIGNHTYSHRRSVLFSGVGPFMAEIRQAEEAIYAVTGERPNLFRMPYGTNFPEWPVYRRALERNGFRHISWNVNSFDSLRINVPAERIVAEVKRQIRGKDVATILFHDLVSTTTADALPEIIQYLKGQGYFIWAF